KTVYAMNKQFLSGGDRGSMTQIDATTLAVIRTVGDGGSPSGAVVESDGRIFVANQRDGTISVIPDDCCSPVLESVTATPTEPHTNARGFSWEGRLCDHDGGPVTFCHQW